jgi:hypothetical protein
VQLWVVWYHRLIGDTEGPALITDTACTATYCRFPSWHTDNYFDNGRPRGQRPDRAPRGIERIIGGRQAQLPALLQKSFVQDLQTVQPDPDAVVRRYLRECHAALSDLQHEPRSEPWITPKQQRKRTDGTAPFAAHGHGQHACIFRHAGMSNERTEVYSRPSACSESALSRSR